MEDSEQIDYCCHCFFGETEEKKKTQRGTAKKGGGSPEGCATIDSLGVPPLGGLVDDGGLLWVADRVHHPLIPLRGGLEGEEHQRDGQQLAEEVVKRVKPPVTRRQAVHDAQDHQEESHEKENHEEDCDGEEFPHDGLPLGHVDAQILAQLPEDRVEPESVEGKGHREEEVNGGTEGDNHHLPGCHIRWHCWVVVSLPLPYKGNVTERRRTEGVGEGSYSEIVDEEEDPEDQVQDDIDDDVHGLPLLDGLALGLRGGEVKDLDPQEEDDKVGREEEDGGVGVDEDIDRVVHLKLAKGNGGLQEKRCAAPYGEEKKGTSSVEVSPKKRKR